jgi:hypothetical protein
MLDGEQEDDRLAGLVSKKEVRHRVVRQEQIQPARTGDSRAKYLPSE